MEYEWVVFCSYIGDGVPSNESWCPFSVVRAQGPGFIAFSHLRGDVVLRGDDFAGRHVPLARGVGHASQHLPVQGS